LQATPLEERSTSHRIIIIIIIITLLLLISIHGQGAVKSQSGATCVIFSSERAKYLEGFPPKRHPQRPREPNAARCLQNRHLSLLITFIIAHTHSLARSLALRLVV